MIPRARLRLLVLAAFATFHAAAATPASANEAQYYLCKAARALGSAAARAHIFGEVFGTDIPAEQAAGIRDHMTAARIYIAEAEALFGEPFATERGRSGAGARVLGMIDRYLDAFAILSAPERTQRVEQIFSVYEQGLHYTFVSSRPDSFQWNANCDTQVLRTCFHFGKAIIAAASVGTPGRPPFVDGYQGQANEQMLQAVQGGLALAMDAGARPPDGHADKVCCGFGTPAEWAAKPAFTRSSPSGLYVGFEQVMLTIFANAAPAPGAPCHGNTHVCASSYASTSSVGAMTPTDVRVYEAGRTGERTFGSAFERSTARYVGWEAHFSHPASGRRVAFAIDYWIRGPDGILGQGTLDTHLEPGWVTSHHFTSWGWDEPGHWPVGSYRIELSLAGRPLPGASFQIVGGAVVAVQPDAGGTPPSDRSTLPPDRGTLPPDPPSDCPPTAASPDWDMETGPGAITRWHWNAGLGLYCGYLRSGGGLNQYRLEPSGNGYYLLIRSRTTGALERTMRMDRGEPPDPASGWAEVGPVLALQPDGTWKEISWWFSRVP